MSQATVYGAGQYGLVTDVTATGLYVGTASFDYSSSQATAPNHIGCTIMLSIYDQKIDVSVDGVIAAKGTGLVGDLGAVISLAATTNNSRTRFSEAISETPVANSAIILTGGGTSGTATGFETGKLSGVFYPSIATNSPTTLT
jgi:hypothetical protein